MLDSRSFIHPSFAAGLVLALVLAGCETPPCTGTSCSPLSPDAGLFDGAAGPDAGGLITGGADAASLATPDAPPTSDAPAAPFEARMRPWLTLRAGERALHPVTLVSFEGVRSVVLSIEGTAPGLVLRGITAPADGTPLPVEVAAASSATPGLEVDVTVVLAIEGRTAARLPLHIVVTGAPGELVGSGGTFLVDVEPGRKVNITCVVPAAVGVWVVGATFTDTAPRYAQRAFALRISTSGAVLGGIPRLDLSGLDASLARDHESSFESCAARADGGVLVEGWVRRGEVDHPMLLVLARDGAIRAMHTEPAVYAESSPCSHPFERSRGIYWSCQRVLHRFDVGLAPDPGFGLDGEVVIDGTLVAIDSHDRAIYLRGERRLGRLRADGSPDPDFAVGGTTPELVPPAGRVLTYSQWFPWLMDTEDRLIATLRNHDATNYFDESHSVQRFLGDGQLDPRFGVGGQVDYRTPGGADYAKVLGVLSTGEIILRHLASPSPTGPASVLRFERLTPTGEVDLEHYGPDIHHLDAQAFAVDEPNGRMHRLNIVWGTQYVAIDGLWL